MSHAHPTTAWLRLTPAGLVRLTTASLIGLLLIIPSGALVRLTGSGLGCPDWPGCNGEVIPPLAGHAWIEYSNRLFSAAVVIVATITWIAVVRSHGTSRSFRRWAAVPALAGIGQGPLGALTVLSDLHPLLVSSHFLLSLIALGAGVVTVVLARDHRDGRARRAEAARGRAAIVGLLALTGVVVTGVLVTAAGPHSGDPKEIDRFGNLSDAAAVHVRFVIAFVVIAALLVVWCVRGRRVDPGVGRLAGVGALLLGGQIGLGEYQYRHQLPWEVIFAHVTVAGAVWSCGVALAWLLARPVSAPVPVPPARAAQPAGDPLPDAARHAAKT